MRWSRISLQLERDGLVFIFEDVPALVCSVCGEEDIPGKVAEEIGEIAEQLIQTAQAAADRPLPVQRINIHFVVPSPAELVGVVTV